MNETKNETKKTGLILAIKDIASGDWDVRASLRFETAECNIELRHQSQRASQSMLSYHHRECCFDFSPTLTWEEFRAWKENHTETFESLSANYYEKFDGSNLRGHFKEDLDAYDLIEYLRESASAAASLEACDYSENDTATIKDICRDYKVDEALLIEDEEEREEALERIAVEIADAALDAGCVALYVRAMVEAYAEIE